MLKVYGIKNCDTVKKAIKWFSQENINYQFHDVRQEPLSAEQLQHWGQTLGLDQLLNKRSTTWKQLDDASKSSCETMEGAVETILLHPTLMKRPVVDGQDQLIVGFNATTYQKLFKN